MKFTKNIALKNIIFSFAQQQKKFFNDLSIEFKPQAINFIQGKNGVGKSTLLQILSGKMGKEHFLQGQLQIDDQIYDLSQSKEIMKHVAFVPQKFQELLVDAYSFHENMQFAGIAHFPSLAGLPTLQQIPSLIEKYGIDYEKSISLLSGGQRQILSILMMLALSPKILLLDEPTAALDEENANVVMDFLQDLTREQGVTIIAIVHSHELVEKYRPDGYFELKNHDGQPKINFVSLIM